MKKVLGMGNALVDMMIVLDNESILEKFSLPKGSMQLVNKEFVTSLLDQASGLSIQQSSGGSAANTIIGLSNLGVQTSFIGKVGKDNFGDFFRSDMQENKINPKLFTGENESGRAIALISPDSERTFATFLGASIELSENDLDTALFQGYDYFHIEGYQVQDHNLIKKAVSLARDNDLIVSIDMASYNIVEENLEFLKDIIRDYINITFANEEEARVLTGKEPEEATNEIARICDIAVVKTGEKGSIIKQGDKTCHIPAFPVNCIDTTGAGDLYASGFLYGLILDKPLKECGKIGSLVAGKVIENIGSKLKKDQWFEINNSLKSLLK